MKTDRSTEMFRVASQYMPGGVNSPVRAFKAVGEIQSSLRKLMEQRLLM